MEPVNAAEDETGQLRETDRRTNVWAWRHPHRVEGTVTYTRLQGSVVLDHVDFGYDEKKLVLHDISLWAKPGQKIAFAGATGAGKTTITNLINRFYDIADGFIRRLPDGYDTMLTGDGANLSQGQRQLLAIARAAVADPPVLILDEATSSMEKKGKYYQLYTGNFAEETA